MICVFGNLISKHMCGYISYSLILTTVAEDHQFISQLRILSKASFALIT